jgi:hypothetical protein
MQISVNLSICGTIVCTPAPSGGPILEANVWPQPDFNADTGLTLVNMIVFEGTLQSDGSESGAQSCTMTTPPTFNAGETWHYSVTRSALTGVGTVLEIGGATAVSVSGDGGTGATGSVTIPGSPVNQVRFYEPTGFQGINITSFTLQREV